MLLNYIENAKDELRFFEYNVVIDSSFKIIIIKWLENHE
jgi:hypothetical protein